jgi:ribonuclease BN (tRNA processing enzyme)
MMALAKTLPCLTILGSGTCVPSLKRSSSAALLQLPAAQVLIDAGPGTLRRILEAGTHIHDISHIFLTHFHPDHSAELVPFLFSSKYPAGNARQRPLTLVAGKGLERFYHGLKGVYGHWIELGAGMIDIIELDNSSRDQRRFSLFTVESMPVNHCEESLAYRFITPDHYTVVFSGDTDFSENLVHLAREADLMVCEAALPDELKVSGHLTPSLSGTIATRAGVKKLVLTHFYPECEDADIEAECRRTYAGPLVLATDLLKLDLAAD